MHAHGVTPTPQTPGVRCPECDARAVIRVDDDGYDLLVCPDDCCPRIVVALLVQSEPTP